MAQYTKYSAKDYAATGKWCYMASTSIMIVSYLLVLAPLAVACQWDVIITDRIVKNDVGRCNDEG